MLDDLVVLHYPSKAAEQLIPRLHALEWHTCLRRVSFLHRSEYSACSLEQSAEVYEGKEAYGFLLQVICGLRSPLVGETAVLGQFREFIAKVIYPNSPWGSFLRQFFSALLIDAKQIRHRHLQGLGSQSYGGLIRQHLRGVQSVSLIGAGQLAEEIFPWLIGKTAVTVFYRSPVRAHALIQKFPEVCFQEFACADSAITSAETAVLIAAPVRAKEIENWIAQQSSSIVRILDFRGEAEADPINMSFPTIHLSDLFASFEFDRAKGAAQIATAHLEINAAAQRWSEQAQFRPFGWEDLCA